MTPAPSPTPIDPLAIIPNVVAAGNPYQWVIVVVVVLVLAAVFFGLVIRYVRH